jgi:hypothetical protein
MPQEFNGFTRERFIEYLNGTLIPDLKESGRDMTAEDFETAVHFMQEQPEKKEESIDIKKFEAVRAEVRQQLDKDEDGGYDGENDDLPITIWPDDYGALDADSVIEAVYTAYNGPQEFSATDGDFDKDESATASHIVKIRNGDCYLIQWNNNMALTNIQYIGRK